MSLKFGPGVRLRSRREYVAVQQKGRRVATRFLTMLALPNSLHHNRLGIVASRRVGGAVVRNRAKRRLRALFRLTAPDLVRTDGRPGLDLVVIVRSDLAGAPADQLSADFTTALTRLGARAQS
jgi:ribonuclease P protein component